MPGTEIFEIVFTGTGEIGQRKVDGKEDSKCLRSDWEIIELAFKNIIVDIAKPCYLEGWHAALY